MVVTDPGGKKGETELDISISDVNDNRPMFTASTFEVTLFEGRPVGSLVFTAHAIDADAAPNSDLKYKIVAAHPIHAKYLFDMDATTGRIITTKQIKRQDFSV